jgi:thymidylate synthase (FAD)
MKIVKPYYKILTPLEDAFKAMLEHCEYCARISHRSEDRITHGSAQKLLEFIVMGKGDFSVIEHSMMTVEFLVDRGITHELVRHRIASYTQESTRFVNYEKKMPPSFIYPQVGVECDYCLAGDSFESENFDAENMVGGSPWRHRVGNEYVDCLYDPTWLSAIAADESAYKFLVKPIDRGGKGWRPQEARSIFPNALASKIAVTMNWRTWRHLMIMRATKEAHPQFRQVSVPLLHELKNNQYIGWLFADLEPGMSQAEAMKHMR